jgi:hypothetical protein
MINPSAPGWIAKYFTKQNSQIRRTHEHRFVLSKELTTVLFTVTLSLLRQAATIETEGWVQNELPK